MKERPESKNRFWRLGQKLLSSQFKRIERRKRIKWINSRARLRGVPDTLPALVIVIALTLFNRFPLFQKTYSCWTSHSQLFLIFQSIIFLQLLQIFLIPQFLCESVFPFLYTSRKNSHNFKRPRTHRRNENSNFHLKEIHVILSQLSCNRTHIIIFSCLTSVLTFCPNQYCQKRKAGNQQISIYLTLSLPSNPQRFPGPSWLYVLMAKDCNRA